MTQPNPAPVAETAALPTAPDPSETVSSAGETAEQKAARLDAELAAEREKVENERKLRLSHEQKLRDTQQELDRQRAAATPPASADPLDRMIAALESEREILAANNYPTASVEAQIYDKQRERDYNQRRARIEEQRREAEREFSAMEQGSDRAFVAKARELFYSGNFASPQIALGHAKAIEAPDMRAKYEAEKKRADDLERDLKARSEGRVSAGAAPVISLEKPPDPNQKLRVRRSDWSKLDSMPPAVQRDWNAAFNAGRLEFID